MIFFKECPKLKKCPIFLKSIQSKLIGKAYKSLYCQTMNERHLECKRYIASEKYKKPIPENILPNSSLTIEEIGKRIHADESNDQEYLGEMD